MDLTTLAQQISDATQIGKNDVQLIIDKAFSLLMEKDEKTTLTIPQCGTTPERNFTILRT